MDSILTSIKKLLGIPEEYTAFDADLLIHINSVLAILTQMGIGPSDGFIITDNVEHAHGIGNNKAYQFRRNKLS